MNLADLTFLRPGWLLALLPLALLAWHLWRTPGDSGTAWRRVVDAHLLPHLLVGGSPAGRRAGVAALAAGFALAVLALAGPAVASRTAGAQVRDLTRVLVVDLSSTAHLESARLKTLALLRARPEGQTALVVYAGEPYLVVPPSSDVETIARFVPELAADAVPVPGDRPVRALRLAAQVLARSGSAQRDLVWITAGADATGLPVAELAGVRLAVLHAGATDAPALAALARQSGGAYARLQGGDADVGALAAALAPRGGWTGADSRPATADLGPWLLLPLLPLAALAFRRGLLLVLLVPLGLAGLPAPAQAGGFGLPDWLADYRAWRRFSAGAPDADFADPRWRAVALYRAGRFGEAAALLAEERDPDSLYNRGNALARHGRLPDALAAYEAALDKRPDDADIRHNRDLVQRLLNQEGGAGKPPPPAPKPADRPPPAGNAEREAARLAEQWLRSVPDEPGSLLRRKLEAEHRRRQAGEVAKPW